MSASGQEGHGPYNFKERIQDPCADGQSSHLSWLCCWHPCCIYFFQ